MAHPHRKLQQVPEEVQADARFPGPDPDEISLFDLWNVLVRRRWLVAAVAAVVFGGAVGAVALMPQQFGFRTAIEIGSFVQSGADGDERRFVEAPAIVEHKLLEAYVPMVRSQLADRQQGGVPGIRVNTKAESAVFVLSSEATPENAELLATIHQRVADLLLEDHQRVVSTVLAEQRGRLEAKRAELAHLDSESVRDARIGALERRHQAARADLAALEDAFRVRRLERQSAIAKLQGSLEAAAGELEVLQARRERLSERAALLEDQIASTRALLADLRRARSEAIPGAAEGANAVAVLMVGSEVAATERRLWELEQELRLDLAARRENLDQEMAANRIRQDNLRSQLAELQARVSQAEADHQRQLAAGQADVRQLAIEVSKGREDYKLEHARLEQAVDTLEAGLNDVRETRAVYVASRSPEGSGPGLAVAGALGGVLGLMLGVFAAFMREFAHRASLHRRGA